MAFALALDIIVFNVTTDAAFAPSTPSSARPCPVRSPCHSPLAQTTELTPTSIEYLRTTGSHRDRLEQSRSVTIVRSGPFEDHLPTLQHVEPVADLARAVNVLLDEQDRDAAPAQASDRGKDVVDDHRCESF